MGTPLRVHQSPTAGNPPTALDSPQRAASFLRRQSLMGETTPDASSRRSRPTHWLPQDRAASPLRFVKKIDFDKEF
ncbi:MULTISPECIES: hypothetical protein, partial [unclassified Nostoc]|uniref:hypothetical protein n=1 Tax=unclassified Nostoc TaxID=2593658 RepID=UPI0026356516